MEARIRLLLVWKLFFLLVFRASSLSESNYREEFGRANQIEIYCDKSQDTPSRSEEGKSIQEMVHEALRQVPNDNGDQNIGQVNQIRESLAIMGDNSTAFSLPLPHLQRTKLCDLNDTDLDPLYVERREQLKELVASIVRPKIVRRKSLDGKEFVSFLEQMLMKSKSLFIKLYNQRLFNWLVAFSLIMVVVGRFVVKFILLEVAAWIMFIFLETYTRMFWSAESLYYNPAWHFIVATCETIVCSPFLDLDRWSVPMGIFLILLLLYCKCYGRRKHGNHSLLPMYES